MAKMTVGFGVLLMVVSVTFWVLMGRAEMAALHPAGVGLLLVVCGLLANTENTRQRMIWMHAAVMFGLIGFLITGIRAGIEMAGGHILPSVQMAFDERVVVALVCLVYVILCVRSFIAARRARVV